MIYSKEGIRKVSFFFFQGGGNIIRWWVNTIFQDLKVRIFYK